MFYLILAEASVLKVMVMRIKTCHTGEALRRLAEGRGPGWKLLWGLPVQCPLQGSLVQKWALPSPRSQSETCCTLPLWVSLWRISWSAQSAPAHLQDHSHMTWSDGVWGLRKDRMLWKVLLKGVPESPENARYLYLHLV